MNVSVRKAILTGWLSCAVLDITAACIQSWVQVGRTPPAVLKGVASALWGAAAMTAGPGMAAVGLLMHFTVALTWTLVFYALSRRIAYLRNAPLLIVGPLYGASVFCAMNYGTLPLLSWVRSFYLGTPPAGLARCSGGSSSSTSSASACRSRGACDARELERLMQVRL